MKQHILLAFAFTLLCLPAMAQERLGIAAVVNNEVLTTSDVQGRVSLALQGAKTPPDAEIQKQIAKQALDALIDEQIRLQEARRLGVAAKKEEVDKKFSDVAGQNNMTAEQFSKMLRAKPGLEASLRRQMETQIAWSNVVLKKIRPQVTISETDISAYMDEQKKNPAKIEYQVAEIFLRNNPANQALAQQIIAQLKEGKRFSVLARQFSQGLEASKGGMLGWLPEKRLEQPLDDAIKATPAGQITGIVQSQRGLHIFLVREKRDILPLDQASQRLKLKQIVLPLPPQISPEDMQKAQTMAQNTAAQITSCEAADAMIKKINMPMSKDLGEVRLSDLPQSIIDAVKDLPVGKSTAPIRANDGLVIMTVCGRADNADAAMRDDVANMLGTERLNRLQFRYYRDLRAAAYVDIK